MAQVWQQITCATIDLSIDLFIINSLLNPQRMRFLLLTALFSAFLHRSDAGSFCEARSLLMSEIISTYWNQHRHG